MGDLTVLEAAQRLNAAASTVRKWLREGRFPNARQPFDWPTSPWLIPEGDIESFKRPLMGNPKTRKSGESEER